MMSASLRLGFVLACTASPLLQACTCLPSTFESYWRSAPIVVEVMITAKRDPARPHSLVADTPRVWKGAAAKALLLPPSAVHCGPSFDDRAGQRVIAYLFRGTKGGVTFGMCGRVVTGSAELEREERLLRKAVLAPGRR